MGALGTDENCFETPEMRVHDTTHADTVRDAAYSAGVLRSRRDRLAETIAVEGESMRYFPVLSVLAPVMTQTEGEITYPGDPMCLYSALSVAVHRAVADAGPLNDARHYNDLAPQWTRYPSKEYRLRVQDDGYRPYRTDPNTDETVFDPRVWDEMSRARWIQLLREVRPRVVLISAVSPAHRYALEIATLVKAEVPRAFVVLGGRHVDETISVVSGRSRVVQRSSSTLAVMADGRAPRVVDAVVTGEAYFSLDVLMRALALSMDLTGRWVDAEEAVGALRYLLHRDGPPAGKSAIYLADASGSDGTVHAFPFDGSSVDLASLPAPYEAFAIRSHFPIFSDPETGRTLRTAHFMMSNSCPYQCNFCSESSLLNTLNRFKGDAVHRGVDRVCEYVSYGAESIFFDDSIFWSGRFSDIISFCTELRDARECARAALPARYRELLDETDMARFKRLQWGAQLTVDTLVALHRRQESAEVLRRMREAGCNYVYVGVESMSEQVMGHVHKNLRKTGDGSWPGKVRDAVSLVKDQGLRVGTSVLFGLEGETRGSIDETIEEVGKLIDNRLIDLASPNILTYHPATPITRKHGMHDKLDYHSPRVDNRRPYTYFEEAFPGVVSRSLSEDDIWHIHRETEHRWSSVRNDTSPETGDRVPGLGSVPPATSGREVPG